MSSLWSFYRNFQYTQTQKSYQKGRNSAIHNISLLLSLFSKGIQQSNLNNPVMFLEFEKWPPRDDFQASLWKFIYFPPLYVTLYTRLLYTPIAYVWFLYFLYINMSFIRIGSHYYNPILSRCNVQIIV